MVNLNELLENFLQKKKIRSIQIICIEIREKKRIARIRFKKRKPVPKLKINTI